MVRKAMILLWIQHLEQSRSWVAPEVVPQLVELVEHEHGVVGPRLLHALNQPARQRSDVRPAVATNLGLVAHPPQRDADELAAEGPGDRPAERRLPDAGRAHQTQDGTLLVGLELPDGQILEDALLHLLEVVVIRVQDVASGLDVELVLGRHRPGELDQPLEVGPGDGVLGGRRLHHLQALELLHRHLLDVGGHLRVQDLLAKVVEVAAGFVNLPQLFLDGLQLLPQHVLALVAAHLFLDLAVDLLADLQHLVLAGQELQHLAQPGLEVERLQDVLLFVDLHVQVRRDQIRQLPGLGHAVHQRRRLLGQFGHQLDDPLGYILEVHHQGVQLDLAARLIGQRLHPRRHERVDAHALDHPNAGDALQDDGEVVLGELDDLEDPGGTTDRIQVARPGIFGP